MKNTIPPRSGVAFELKPGQRLRVTDIQGEQVSDLICFNKHDKNEWLSSGRTLDYEETLFPTTGAKLYSNRSRVMLEVVADTVGRHDFLLTPCSKETFSIIYGHEHPHRGCHGNLSAALAEYDISPDQIPTTFNIFMNVDIAMPSGKLKVLPPKSRAGDIFEVEAKMNLIVGLTACSAEQSNNFSFKPIDYEILTSVEFEEL